MTNTSLEECLEIMRTEKACVIRNETNNCDRDCYNCDLLRPTDKVLEAYAEVICILEGYKKPLKMAFEE